MRRPGETLLIAACLVFWATTAWADTVVIHAKTLHTSGPMGTIDNGVVVVKDGAITAVGAVGTVEEPKDAEVLHAEVVTPGLIDTHSVAGLAGMYNVPADQDQDETTGPNQAGLRAIDGFNPNEPLLDWLLMHGVTVVQSGPGERNPIGGQAGVFKTQGVTVDAMTMRFPSAVVFSLGEVPKSTYGGKGQRPSTRMGTAALLRATFIEAQAYDEKLRKSEEAPEEAPEEAAAGDGAESDEEQKSPPEPPARDLNKEALVRVLRKEIPAVITARREDDIMTALRIAKEFDIEIEIADGSEAYLVAEQLVAAQVPVHVGPVMARIGSLERMNQSFQNAAFLDRAGIPITFQSGFEGYVPKTRVVLFEAALAGTYDLGFDRALRALTIDAAERLRIADRVGSIEVGKDADLVLFDGDPFEYVTHVEAVLIDGNLAHRRDPDMDYGEALAQGVPMISWNCCCR